MELRQDRRWLIFIAHDLAVVSIFPTGRRDVFRAIVELAPTVELFARPLHPYTKALLAAILVPDPEYKRERLFIGWRRRETIPGQGCRFAGRRPQAGRNAGGGTTIGLRRSRSWSNVSTPVRSTEEEKFDQ